MSFVVVYDACVLYPAPLRDLLLELAISELYAALQNIRSCELVGPAKHG